MLELQQGFLHADGGQQHKVLGALLHRCVQHVLCGLVVNGPRVFLQGEKVQIEQRCHMMCLALLALKSCMCVGQIPPPPHLSRTSTEFKIQYTLGLSIPLNRTTVQSRHSANNLCDALRISLAIWWEKIRNTNSAPPPLPPHLHQRAGITYQN